MKMGGDTSRRDLNPRIPFEITALSVRRLQPNSATAPSLRSNCPAVAAATTSPDYLYIISSTFPALVTKRQLIPIRCLASTGRFSHRRR
jgi:hypothetical protein